MDTFGGNLQLAGFGDLDSLDGLVARLSLRVLDLLDDLVALEDLAEDDVAAIEPTRRRYVNNQLSSIIMFQGELLRGQDSGDEELGAVGVGAGVGHGQEALLGVLQLEVLVGELLAVDYRTVRSTCLCRVNLGRIDSLDLPPVPSPLVKSPPWIMKFLMTRWTVEPS